MKEGGTPAPAHADPRAAEHETQPRGGAAGRIRALDGLRGIAALSVVLFHYTYFFGNAYGRSGSAFVRFEQGQYGVDVFFIISGFVILMTLSRTETWKDFVVSRVSRIYPAYWAAVLLTFSVVSLASLPGREATLPEALVNLTMLQDWLGAARVDGVYWTLSVELSFYALMLAAFGVGLIKQPLLIGLIWLSALPLALLLFLLSFELPARFLLFVLAVRYAHLFIAGMMFYELYLGRKARPRYLLLAYCLIAHAIWNGVGASFLVVSVAYAVIWLVVHGRLTVLGARPLVLLGAISYPLYLIHQNLGYVSLRFLEGDLGLDPNISIVLTIGVVLLLAAAITITVERPAQAAIRGAYRKRGTSYGLCRQARAWLSGFGGAVTPQHAREAQPSRDERSAR